MTASLPVELNDGRIHEIRVVDEFEAAGPFAVDLVNRGQPIHVHVGLDEDLARVASLDEVNHFVRAGASEVVPIDVSPVDEETRGLLSISTGYGAETADVAVTVRPWEDRSSGVEVSEDLASPSAEPADPTETGSRPSVPLLALVGTALVLAVIVGYGATSPAVLVGAGVVVGAALAALAFSLR